MGLLDIGSALAQVDQFKRRLGLLASDPSAFAASHGGAELGAAPSQAGGLLSVVPQVREDAITQAMQMTPGLLAAIVYHGGPRRVTAVDPVKLQSRDYGFYGEGFYVTDSPGYAKNYGRAVSKFDLADNAKILKAATTPQKAPELADQVATWYENQARDAAMQRGKLSALAEEVAAIKTNPLAFAHAVDRYAIANGYDAVRYGPYEIVVKNIGVLTPIK